jgi:hypothetical protein
MYGYHAKMLVHACQLSDIVTSMANFEASTGRLPLNHALEELCFLVIGPWVVQTIFIRRRRVEVGLGRCPCVLGRLRLRFRQWGRRCACFRSFPRRHIDL